MYIGIDLGTSNSVIAGVLDGKPRIFHPTDGGEVLPSVIYIDKRGHRLYGRRARDQGLIAPENVAEGFKRLIGSSTPITVEGAGLTLTPEECSAEIIRQLLGQASTETGLEEFDGIVITIPASFNQMQAEATLRAAKMAGLKRVDLLQEPVAAAMAAMADAQRSGHFLIYDLGGGTFDLALAEAKEGEVGIVAHQGINMLGGRDFDRLIVKDIIRPWLLDNFDLPVTFARDKAYQRLMRIATMAAEKAKIDLSRDEEAIIFASDDDIRLADQLESEIHIDITITRDQFDALIRPTIMQTINLIRRVLEENSVTPGQIDRVVYIGGPSRIPLVRKIVSEELGIQPDLTTDPMTAVAIGAAYYAESREWDANDVSKRKESIAKTNPVLEAPGLLFDYVRRTPTDKTVITVHLADGSPETLQLRMTTGDWDSGLLPLTDGLTVMAPLANVGENLLEVTVIGIEGETVGEKHTLIVTRVVASASSIPAAQTISVKILEKIQTPQNILLPLVTKGTPLQIEGQTKFVCARELKAHGGGCLSFEIFQVEYPERIELNLCVGAFRIGSEDLPDDYVIHKGDPIIFDWKVSESGILEAHVILPSPDGNEPIELKAPRFYAPQAGQISFTGDTGKQFAEAILTQGEEEWGDITAAIGPEGGAETQLLRTRLMEQRESLEDSLDDPEALRHLIEETRFIRQDIARLGRKYRAALFQRRLGKLATVFNRMARTKATDEEQSHFDDQSLAIQQIIDEEQMEAYDNADLYLRGLRDIFFSIAWRDINFVGAWFKRLSTEGFLFPNQEEFEDLVKEGKALTKPEEAEKLRSVVSRMLDIRVAIAASDSATELATIAKG